MRIVLIDRLLFPREIFPLSGRIVPLCPLDPEEDTRVIGSLPRPWSPSLGCHRETYPPNILRHYTSYREDETPILPLSEKRKNQESTGPTLLGMYPRRVLGGDRKSRFTVTQKDLKLVC